MSPTDPSNLLHYRPEEEIEEFDDAFGPARSPRKPQRESADIDLTRQEPLTTTAPAGEGDEARAAAAQATQAGGDAEAGADSAEEARAEPHPQVTPRGSKRIKQYNFWVEPDLREWVVQTANQRQVPYGAVVLMALADHEQQARERIAARDNVVGGGRFTKRRTVVRHTEEPPAKRLLGARLLEEEVATIKEMAAEFGAESAADLVVTALECLREHMGEES